jgi:glucosyl-dolichyl phosphate glucuronosyltransferase
LEHLCSQTIEPAEFDVLIIDNGTGDETRKPAEAAIRSHPQHHVRYIRENVPGSVSGRHRGTLEADSELLVFIDDDVDVAAGWLSAILDGFNDPKVHLLGGRNLPRYEVDPPRWVNSFWTSTPYGGQMCVSLSLLDLGDSPLMIDASYVWSLNLAIRKKTLFELGGFHPDSTPAHVQRFQGNGETGLAAKATARGLGALYQPNATVYHRIPGHRLTRRYFEQRAFFEGVALSYSTIRCNGAVSEKTWQPRFRLAESFSGMTRGETDTWTRWQSKRREMGFRRFLSRNLSTAVQLDREMQVLRIKNAVRCAFLDGYEFHHKEVALDPRLLEWVLREDYWDWDYTKMST